MRQNLRSPELPSPGRVAASFNQHMQPDPAIGPSFHVERHLRGAADVQRWPS